MKMVTLVYTQKNVTFELLKLGVLELPCTPPLSGLGLLAY